MTDESRAPNAWEGPAGAPGPAPQSYWVQPEQARRYGPAPGFEYAGFWIRLAAYLLDLIPWLIVAALLFVPLFTTFFELARDLPSPPAGAEVGSAEYQAWQALLMEQMNEAFAGFGPISGLLQLGSIVYYVGFWTWRGQTPGKMLLGLRIVRDSDAVKPGLARSILRYVGYIISGIPLFLGFIWIAFDGRKQGWHDKISGTVVLRRAG